VAERPALEKSTFAMRSLQRYIENMDRKPTEQERKAAHDETVADLLPYVMHDIAESLGIPPDKEWTQEEQDRISAEADRIYGGR
jgi:hypothetical protein